VGLGHYLGRIILPALGPARGTLQGVSNLQKRGGYTPRKSREQRAYRLVVIGGATGVLGGVGLVLAIAGVIGAFAPIVLILVAIACAFTFRGMTR
jgi:hypothetical protein